MSNLINYDNGTVTVSVTGGTAPYSFLLQQNGTAFNYTGANFINPINSSGGQVTFGDANDQSGDSGLPAGTYTCQITDANGCIVTTPDLTVNQNIPTTTTAAPTYSVTITAVADPANIVGSHPLIQSGLSQGDSYTLPGPTWSVTGYEFIGYDTYSGTPTAPPQYQPGDVITIAGDTDLFARYQEVTTTTTTLAQYTLTITAIADPANIVGTHPYVDSNILDGSTITLPGPTWSVTGYTFTGYDTYSGTPMAPPQYQPGDSLVITGDTNLYARYELTTTTTTLPTFTCSEANVVINDGAVGDPVVAQIDEGTIDSITPSTYQLGNTTYSVTIFIPSGYDNAGGDLVCTAVATGTTTTTTTTLPTFTCSEANVVINDGAVGDPVVAQVDEGTIDSITPSTCSEVSVR